MRLPGQACRHGAADVFQVGERRGALDRTRRRAQQLRLEAPEQSLKLLQPAGPQLGAGDDLRHPFLLSVARPRRSGPFLRPRVTIEREGLSDGGLKAAETGEKKDRNRRRAAAQRAGSGLYSWTTEGALRRRRERPGATGASAGQGERASMVAKPRLSIGCRDLQILTKSCIMEI